MNPEQLVDQLKKALPAGLRSVVLYGSAATGDYIAGKSDYNVLIVADKLGVAELDALSKPSIAWSKAGNRAPLVFTPEQLKASADSFPIEVSDMQQSSKILFGSDLLSGIMVQPEHLRLQLERDMRASLLQLRERYVLTGGKPRMVTDLMASSLSTFLVLFRASLRLYQSEIPQKKLEAVCALSKHIGFNNEVFLTINDYKEGRCKQRELSPGALFEEYLTTIEQIVDAVNSRIHPATRS